MYAPSHYFAHPSHIIFINIFTKSAVWFYHKEVLDGVLNFYFLPYRESCSFFITIFYVFICWVIQWDLKAFLFIYITCFIFPFPSFSVPGIFTSELLKYLVLSWFTSILFGTLLLSRLTLNFLADYHISLESAFCIVYYRNIYALSSYLITHYCLISINNPNRLAAIIDELI